METSELENLYLNKRTLERALEVEGASLKSYMLQSQLQQLNRLITEKERDGCYE